jgi:hypothetical protein
VWPLKGYVGGGGEGSGFWLGGLVLSGEGLGGVGVSG